MDEGSCNLGLLHRVYYVLESDPTRGREGSVECTSFVSGPERSLSEIDSKF